MDTLTKTLSLGIKSTPTSSTLIHLPAWFSWTTFQDLLNAGKQHPWPATHPATPVISVILYFLAIVYFQPSKVEAARRAAEKKKTAEIHRVQGTSEPRGFIGWLIVAHNIGLAVFSLVVFCLITSGMVHNYNVGGWQYMLCHAGDDGYMHALHYAFYVSKMWEYGDGMIQIYRGQRPILLSKYHHIGATLITYIICVSRTPSGWLFTLPNSLVHTFMYTFYAAGLLGYRFKQKILITTIQILQFLIGMYTCITSYFNTKFQTSCSVWNDKMTLTTFLAVSYTAALTVLFGSFFRKAYLVKPKTSAKRKKAA